MKLLFCIALIIFLPFGAKCRQLAKQQYYDWWQVYSAKTFSEVCKLKECSTPKEIFKNEQTSVYISFKFYGYHGRRTHDTTGNCIFYIEHAYPGHYLTLTFDYYDDNGYVSISEVKLDLSKEGVFYNGARFSGNGIRTCCYNVVAKEL